MLVEKCLQDAVVNVEDREAVMQLAREKSLCGSMSKPRAYPEGTNKKAITNATVNDIPELEFANPVSLEEIEIAVKTAEWRMTNDRNASMSGAALVGYWGVVLIVKYIAHYLSLFAPIGLVTTVATCKPVRYLRSRLLNAPLGRRHHSAPWSRVLGIRLPTRSFSTIIALFIALNYCLIFTNFPYEPLNFIYTSRTQQWNKSLAIRAAFMIMWKLPLLFCFAGRNNVLLLIRHPWPLDTFNMFHKWIARVTIVDIIIHGIAISIVKADQGIYGSVWLVDYWQWGIVGIICASLVAFQSMHWISRAKYEIFKVLHIVLAIVFVISSWYHVKTLPYGTRHLYAVFAIWGFDHLGRWIRVFATGVVRARIQHSSDSLSVITIESPWSFRLAHGAESAQYLFLHLPPWYLFWESHPFTVVPKSQFFALDSSGGDSCAGEGKKSVMTTSRSLGSVPASDGYLDQSNWTSRNSAQLMVAIKHQNGITKRLSKMPEGPITLLVEGPYGSPFPLRRFSKVIFIAGGIGITAHLSYVKQLITEPHRSIDLQLHWAVSDFEALRWAFDEIVELVKHNRKLAVCVYSSRKDDAGSNQDAFATCSSSYERFMDIRRVRMNCTQVIDEEISISGLVETPRHGSTAIFACGPPSLNDDARLAACKAIENATIFVDYFEESFSW